LRSPVLSLGTCPYCRGKPCISLTLSVHCVRNFFHLLRNESKWIWFLFASYLHSLVYLQTPVICIICFISHSKYFIQIFDLKCSHTSEYSLCIASNYIGNPFTSLHLNKYSVSFLNIQFIWLQNIPFEAKWINVA
jgi:hypothetical protein